MRIDAQNRLVIPVFVCMVGLEQGILFPDHGGAGSEGGKAHLLKFVPGDFLIRIQGLFKTAIVMQLLIVLGIDPKFDGPGIVPF